jgi:hypothetical protein
MRHALLEVEKGVAESYANRVQEIIANSSKDKKISSSDMDFLIANENF